jgi:hypothetical protein
MSTLGQLKTSVDAWLARDDVAVTNTDFPQILLIAESNIARDLRLAIQEATTTLNITGQSIDLPSDFLEARNPFIDDNIRRIEYMTPQAIRESSAWQNGRAGAFYTLEANNASPLTAGALTWQMTIAGPGSVSTPVDVQINYWARFPGLVNDPDTNWLLVNHYDIYLYATLRASCEYIQEDVLEDRYQAKYDMAVEKQNRHENRKRYGAMPKQAYGNPRGVV